MKQIINNNKNNIILISLLFITLFILAFIYKISNISYSTIKTIVVILNIIFIFIISFNYAKNKEQKGIIIGLKTGIIYILILFILSLLFKTFRIISLIYYALILLSSILGSIISKNKK